MAEPTPAPVAPSTHVVPPLPVGPAPPVDSPLVVAPPVVPSMPAGPRPRLAPQADVTSPRDTREAILTALESLLESRRLDELTVVDLIQAAGISRATFYTYFESKHAAVAARAEGLMEQIHDLWLPWLVAAGPADRVTLEALWLQSIALWRDHQPLLMAAAEAWRADAVVSDTWAILMRRYAVSVRTHIERARANGGAPAGPEPAMLATVLVWLNESALYRSFATVAAPADDDRRLAQTLTAIWMRAIYDACRERPHSMTLPERTSLPLAAPPAPRAAARLRRRGNADVRRAILLATEELLRERPLEDLTAVDVIETAGFSRPTFYMYFESKHAAVAALADDIQLEIYDRLWRRSIEDADAGSPPGTVEHFLETIAGWRTHQAVLVAAAEGWRTDPSVYRQWGARMESFVAATATYIEHARQAGAAPPDPDAETLAALLVWLAETILYLTLSGLHPELGDDQRLAATMSAVWLRAIHGETR